ELEVSRRVGAGDDSKPPVVLARLGAGALFGEMALLSGLPAAASVVAARPSMLLVAAREALEAGRTRHPGGGGRRGAPGRREAGGDGRRQAVVNLGWTSPVVAAVPPEERAVLVERLEARVFDKGERLIEYGQDAPGLHIVVSGEVAVVARDGDERVALATLMP